MSRDPDGVMPIPTPAVTAGPEQLMSSLMQAAASPKYVDPRAHALRARHLATFGGTELPVPVESIAEDLLGLRIEERWNLGDTSGQLLPAERLIVLNAAEHATGRNDPPLRRFRFTIAHELGHWICHARERAGAGAVYCRQADLAQDVDRALEREANVFAAELLMPESAVREAWAEAADVDFCATRFDVSPTAMQWRLYSFGLVENGPT
jgi:IrrE N-terminal-like domain